MIATGPCIKLTTFSSTDAKLRQLFCWYQQHKREILPTYQKFLSRLNIIDITKLRYSEKIAWIKALRAAKKTWKKYKLVNDKKQPLITKFFKDNKAANLSQQPETSPEVNGCCHFDS
jgi:hypothetical protein